MAISAEAKKAIKLGSLCSVSYLAVYIARNILGTLTPQMILGDTFTTENIGTLSSIYFITYAIGQLINGIIGDRIKAKYMLSLGLVLAGICNLTFSFFSKTFTVPYISYLLMGFFRRVIRPSSQFRAAKARLCKRTFSSRTTSRRKYHNHSHKAND